MRSLVIMVATRWVHFIMKIEKINDRQIRCVLTKADLDDRKMRFSELVCGGEKARGLFREMMLQASREFGFSFNNNPLMIEAVMAGKDQLVLIITRVDDPGELDSRFGKSMSGGHDEKQDPASTLAQSLSGADDILNLLKRFAKRVEEKRADHDSDSDHAGDGSTAGISHDYEVLKNDWDEDSEFGMKEKPGKNMPSKQAGQSGTGKGSAPAAMRPLTEEEIYQYTRFYLFRSLENVLQASKRIGTDYEGENSLYKNPDDGAYYLLVRKMDTNPEQFNRICNVLSEYSMPMDYASGMDEFFREHMQVIIADNALQNLRNV